MSANAWDADGSGTDAPSAERCSIQRLRGREAILMSKDVSPASKEEIKVAMNFLMDMLIMYGGSQLGQIYLNGYKKKYGEIPDEYKDAVKALME